MKSFLTVSVCIASLIATSAMAQAFDSKRQIIYPSSPSALLVQGGQVYAQPAPMLGMEPQQAKVDNSADGFANLAPAAGGPRPQTDRNLSSDSNADLRNDSAIIQ